MQVLNYTKTMVKKMASFRISEKTRAKLVWIASYLYEHKVLSKENHTKVIEYAIDKLYEDLQ